MNRNKREFRFVLAIGFFVGSCLCADIATGSDIRWWFTLASVVFGISGIFLLIELFCDDND